MADVHTADIRSFNMSRIRGKGNEETEVRLAKLMRMVGIKGWRRHLPILGRPDFSFQRQKVAVFVDGCFWHGCPRCFRLPKQQSGVLADENWGEPEKGPVGQQSATKAGVEIDQDQAMPVKVF